MFGFFKRRKRQEREAIRARPFPAEWRELLVRKFEIHPLTRPKRERGDR